MRNIFIFAPLAVFMALTGLFALQLGKDPSILPSALIDKPVPAFLLPQLTANAPISQDALKTGAPILLNVFASWCQPCWTEHEVITELAQSGVPIIGLAYKDAREDSQRFLDRLGNPYRAVALDEPGRVAIEFGVYGAPETYVIDGEGNIRYRFPGALTAEIVKTQIQPLLVQLASAS